MKKALICGYFGFYNFGDELLLHIIINDLEKIGITKKDITAISHIPQETKSYHLVNAISRWNPFELIIGIINTDVLIFLGGLFQDKTSLKSFLYYYLILLFGLVFGKKVVFYGAGFGPMRSDIARSLFNRIIGKVSLITIRDNINECFSSYTAKMITSIDPAWSSKANFQIKERFPNINWKKPILGISLRNDKYLTSKHLEFFSDKVSKILQNEDDWQVLFLPCMPTEDLQVCYSLYEHLNKKYGDKRVHLIEDVTVFPVSEQVGLFASCDVMFSMRYHALLIPLAYGKPVIGVACDPKIKALCDYAGQVSFKLQSSLEEPWNYFWQSLDYSTSKAKEASENAKTLHQKNINLLMQLDVI